MVKCSTCSQTKYLCFVRKGKVLCWRCQKIEDVGLERTDFLAKFDRKYERVKNDL